MSLVPRDIPAPVRWLLLAEATLGLAFVVAFRALWRVLPGEGVKLHANIDTGIDLFGSRTELLWLFGIAIAMVVGNTALASRLRTSQPAAAALFLGATIPLLIGFLGVLAFLAALNARTVS